MVQQSHKKYILLMFVAVLVVGAINVPYDRLTWTAQAQYGSLPPGVTAEINVANTAAKIFQRGSDGVEIWGACANSQCQFLGGFNPSFLLTFAPRPLTGFKLGPGIVPNLPLTVFIIEASTNGIPVSAGGQQGAISPFGVVIVFYMGRDPGTNSDVFQINIYNGAGVLIDDSILVFRTPAGSVFMLRQK